MFHFLTAPEISVSVPRHHGPPRDAGFDRVKFDPSDLPSSASLMTVFSKNQ
jgi:hypothetical protein